jgi:tartrate dehydrogenase/decarboxylase/D-malate dehydrogenase
MPYWDEIFKGIAKTYPDVKTDQYHVDALSALFVQHPEQFDVVVASNLFGDILSDLGAAVAGSLGIAPSASLNPERKFPSMFEPVHGSAPDIAGKGIANPIGQVLSGALMVHHLGYPEAAKAIEEAVEVVVADKNIKTRDLAATHQPSRWAKPSPTWLQQCKGIKEPTQAPSRHMRRSLYLVPLKLGSRARGFQ